LPWFLLHTDAHFVKQITILSVSFEGDAFKENNVEEVRNLEVKYYPSSQPFLVDETVNLWLY